MRTRQVPRLKAQENTNLTLSIEPSLMIGHTQQLRANAVVGGLVLGKSCSFGLSRSSGATRAPWDLRTE